MNSAAVVGVTEAGRRRWQLPADVSAFVGRADELALLTAMLPGARLVTVAGPGGVGKTRLALRAAADAPDDYPDGLCLVELSGSTGEEPFYAAVAHGLGLRGGDDRSVLDYLRGKRLLLILDTCEHLTACCARFAARVLRDAAEVTILTTSRQPLHLADERVLRLGPLPVPVGDGDRGPGDAVELFATRAAAALPGFTVSPANLPDVIRLCRRLDGIPLAIELAAVRVRALPLAELAKHLEASFSLLAGGRRGTVPRHQTLRAAIEWSYELCTDDERAVWDRLSAFAWSFDLAAARHVVACAQVPDDQVGDVLAALVDKSVVLLADEDAAGGTGGARFRLPDAVREYAAERLARGDQDWGGRQRHASWYLKLAQDLGHHLVADDQPIRLARLRAEHANLRAALEYGFADPRPDSGPDSGPGRGATRLASVLFPYWLMSGRLSEGIDWQDKTLARLGEPSPERARALANSAMLGAMLGRPQAVTQAQEAVALAARVGDDRTRARGYLALQLALGLSGDFAQALEAATRARRHLTALGAGIALRCLDVQLALTYQLAGDPTAAVDLCKHAAAGLAPGERWLRGCVHIVSALVLYQQPGRQADCAGAADEALGVMRDLDNPMGAAYALEVLGWLAADEGRCERAAWLLGAAQSLWARTGGRLGGNAAMEEHHLRSAGSAVGALGAGHYAELHARGAAGPLGQITALAVGGADTLPGWSSGVPEPRAARDNAADAPAGGPGADLPPVEGLTGRERQVAALVASGLSNREIAARLVISQRTVDAHVNHIFAKLSVSSRVQLTRRLSDRAAPAHPQQLSRVELR
jgi:predicted ATPase/DNA-binding CsgD family transcriptional regulator